MSGKLFNFGIIVSLLLCAATVALWLASCACTISVRCSRSEREVFVLLDRGLVQVDAVRGDTTERGWGFNDYRSSGEWGWGELRMFGPHAGLPGILCLAGFGRESYTRTIGGGFLWPPPTATLSAFMVFFPLWTLVIVGLLLPTTWAIRRRRRDGVCGICSYDLTGNTSGVCPECGTAVVRKVENLV